METRVSGFEKAVSCKSLVCLLQALVGHNTVVELRDEAWARGSVVNVDAFMNVTLCDVIFSDPAGRQAQFDCFFIHGRQIRYVQIPDQISPIAAIKGQLERMSGRRGQQSERSDLQRSRRTRKANQYHRQTVQSLAHRQ